MLYLGNEDTLGRDIIRAKEMREKDLHLFRSCFYFVFFLLLSKMIGEQVSLPASDDHKAPLLPVQEAVEGTHNSVFFIMKSILTLQNFYVILGPSLALFICLFLKLEAPTSQKMLGVIAWVFTWWITQAVPLPVTSMCPLFLFPIFGIASADSVAHSYMNDVVTLVLGSFILALAVERYDVHRRLALNVSHSLLLSFTSVSCTVYTCEQQDVGPTGNVAVLYRSGESGAVIAGAMCDDIHGEHVAAERADGGGDDVGGDGDLAAAAAGAGAFGGDEEVLQGGDSDGGVCDANWRDKHSDGDGCTARALSSYLGKAHLRRDLEALGPMEFAEKMVLSIFGLLFILWMTRRITDDIPGWGVIFHGLVGDGSVSVMVAVLLFIIPNMKGEGEKLMSWDECKKLPWNLILLLGAGFAIADGVESSGLADVLSRIMNCVQDTPYMVVVPSVCLICSIVTEFITSNAATATLLVPLLYHIAITICMCIHLFLCGHIEIKDMLKVGVPLKVVGIAVLSLLMPSLGTIVFGTNTDIQ
ncbi:unnamed protein product [Sphenostylis stenocarpa]|uniref:Uncharacterized protein n=1 Tax=Sphenostylis stenocarpa TaxID=92480 RepID=A0AA86VP18_9FABA|nr:unnamed protein product [Sphenostylis stenocarpa]